MDRITPLFRDRLFTLGILRQHLSDFDVLVVENLIDTGSPWQLLTIFEMETFNGDFTTSFGYTIPNCEIAWHLEAISYALEQRSSELGQFYSKKWVTPFSYRASSGVHKGQGKLFFSLLYFSLVSLRQGYTQVCEVGSGELEGGINHDAVCGFLTDNGQSLNFLLVDPAGTTGDKKIEGCSVSYDKRFVGANEEFDCPVFCDIYDGANYDVIQRSIKAPLKMIKMLTTDFSQSVLMQPYHIETRGFKNNQLPHLLRSFSMNYPEFDNCSDCLKWKALLREFSLDSDRLLRWLMFCDKAVCTPIVGAGTIRALDRADTKKLINLRDYLQRADGLMANIKSLDKHVKVVNASESVRIMPSSWEQTMIKMVREVDEKVVECLANNIVPIYHFMPALVSNGNGIPFYRRIDDINWNVHKFFCEFRDGERHVIDELCNSNNFVEDEFVGDEDRCCGLYVTKKEHFDNPVVPLQICWNQKMPGDLYTVKCFEHARSDSQCTGLWCPRKDGFAMWTYMGKTYPIHLVEQPALTFQTMLKHLHNYEYTNVSITDQYNMIIRMYREHAVKLVERVWGRCTRFESTCIESLGSVGIFPDIQEFTRTGKRILFLLDLKVEFADYDEVSVYLKTTYQRVKDDYILQLKVTTSDAFCAYVSNTIQSLVLRHNDMMLGRTGIEYVNYIDDDPDYEKTEIESTVPPPKFTKAEIDSYRRGGDSNTY